MHGVVLMRDEPNIGRRLLSRLQVIGNCLFFVDAEVPGVSANITLVEDAARKQIEVFVFDCAKKAGANLRSGRNFVESDTTHLALPPKAFTERISASAGLIK